jgi:hypothetical protein
MLLVFRAGLRHRVAICTEAPACRLSEPIEFSHRHKTLLLRPVVFAALARSRVRLSAQESRNVELVVFARHMHRYCTTVDIETLRASALGEFGDRFGST